MAEYLGVSEILKRERWICGQKAGEDGERCTVKAICQVVLLHKKRNLFCR